MGFYVRKRVRVGKGSWLNISKRGVSVSNKVGPLTANSRGRVNLRLGRGIGYRGGCLVAVAIPLTALTAIATALGLLVNRSM